MPKGVWEDVCITIARQKVLQESPDKSVKRKNENRFIRNSHFQGYYKIL
jgi:hypothetical protein